MSICDEEIVEDHALAEVFDCSAPHTAYVECVGSHAWKCESSGTGGEYVYEPDECSDTKAAYASCRPSCGWEIYMETNCSMDCQLDGQKIEIKCPSGPTSCSCVSGPKTGTKFTVARCEAPELAAGLATNCR